MWTDGGVDSSGEGKAGETDNTATEVGCDGDCVAGKFIVEDFDVLVRWDAFNSGENWVGHAADEFFNNGGHAEQVLRLLGWRGRE